MQRARRRLPPSARFRAWSTSTAVAFVAGELTTLRLRNGDTGALTAGLAVVGNVGWLFGIVPVLLFLLLLFPDGRLPSRR